MENPRKNFTHTLFLVIILSSRGIQLVMILSSRRLFFPAPGVHLEWFFEKNEEKFQTTIPNGHLEREEKGYHHYHQEKKFFSGFPFL